MKRLYYFAFGSNINSERLQSRVGEVRKVMTYTLPGFALAFNCGSFTAFANLVETPGAEVEGVVYQLSDYQISRLDIYEGWPRNYQKKYFQLPNGDLAFCYVCYNPAYYTKKKPALDYLNKVLDGCKEHALLRTYNILVDYKTKNYPLKRGNKHKLINIVKSIL